MSAADESGASGDDRGLALPLGVAIAWGVQPPPTRGARPGLSIDKIVAAAVTLADEDGLGGVNMTRVAERVGFTTMSIYRYLTAREDLVMLMSEAAIGSPPPLGGAKRTWRGCLETWARERLAVYRRHPWLLEMPAAARPVLPNQLAWLDALLQRLMATPLTAAEQLSTALLVDGFVGSWARVTAGSGDAVDSDRDRSSVAAQDLQRLVESGRFPALAPMIAAGEFDDPSSDSIDEAFTFGIERIIEGIDVLARRRRAATRKARGPKA